MISEKYLCSKLFMESKIFSHLDIEQLFLSLTGKSVKINLKKMQRIKREWWTYFFGTVETYGMRTLSTNDPKPNRKFDVIFRMVADSKSPNRDSFSLSSSMDLDKSIK